MRGTIRLLSTLSRHENRDHAQSRRISQTDPTFRISAFGHRAIPPPGSVESPGYALTVAAGLAPLATLSVPALTEDPATTPRRTRWLLLGGYGRTKQGDRGWSKSHCPAC